MCHINCNIPVGAAAVLSVTRLFTSHRFAVTVEVLDQISENKTKGKVKKVKRVKKKSLSISCSQVHTQIFIRVQKFDTYHTRVEHDQSTTDTNATSHHPYVHATKQ
uniref:Uncharacterized protein n=1 Tax=Trypanosoma congolense (strain IL3000) TaxID=1068625 RepID=G0ULM1_TRYCI|nr:hypothetical protein, unlikely [Trypanosoma congolense IL3000]